MDTFETVIDIGYGSQYVDLKAQVKFEYEPEQKERKHPADYSQEGIPASVTIYEIWVEGTTDSDLIDIFYLFSPSMLDELEDDILNYIKVQKENTH